MLHGYEFQRRVVDTAKNRPPRVSRLKPGQIKLMAPCLLLSITMDITHVIKEVHPNIFS